MTECPMCSGHGSWSKMREAGLVSKTGHAPLFDDCPRCDGTGDLDQFDSEQEFEKWKKERQR